MRAKRNLKRVPSELLTLIFMPAAVLYMEIVFRIYYLASHSNDLWEFFGRFFGAGLYIIIGFSVAAGIFMTLLSTFFRPRANRIISLCVLAFSSLLFMVQSVYHYSFRTIMKLSLAADTGGDAMKGFFWTVTLPSIAKSAWILILLAVPIILLIIFGRAHLAPRRSHGERWHRLFDKPVLNYVKYPVAAKAVLLILLLVMRFIPLGCIMLTDKNSGLRAHYSTAFEQSVSVEYFGISTTEWLDIKLLTLKTLGIEKDPEILPENSSSESSAEPEPKVYDTNVMDIDFDALLASETDSTLLKMHRYFSERTPTLQNEYTGLFEGYNLITITAEGFSPYCISEELTPTLYKMQQEGFKFPNFYTAGYDDTTSGEFVACTGLIPSNNYGNNFKRVSDNLLAFCMGRQFQKLGVPTYAYHNHTYTYYGRDITHPNMGYDVYKGNGNGIVLEHPNWWPESDLEMMNSTVSDYLGKGRFHAYYMTVSGHKDYSFSDNMMSYKNREAVAGLPYTEKVRAYLAANIELDRAMESLLASLELNGQLDNTVIAITPDHKPQELTNDEVAELAGRELDNEFEIYRSVFLLYCAGYKDAPTITAPANSLDIIPTISNLMGLDYDSRLLMGRDLLDEQAEQVITFRTRSWISDKGRYNFKTQEFIPAEGVVLDNEEEYVNGIRNMVSNKFTMSELIITQDYYRKLFSNN